jgi:hypothetical protein
VVSLAKHLVVALIGVVASASGCTCGRRAPGDPPATAAAAPVDGGGDAGDLGAPDAGDEPDVVRTITSAGRPLVTLRAVGPAAKK